MASVVLLALGAVPAQASAPAATVGPAAVTPAAVTPAAGSCQIRILGTKKVRGSLRAAVAAASKNQRLSVKGTCRGTARIDKSLTILGARSSTGRPTLDGGGKGPVIIVPAGVKVTILSIDITGGVTDKGDGAALSVGGTVLFQGGRIRDNRTTADAAAIGIRPTGKVTLGGGADVHYNDAPDGGSVVRVTGGSLVLTGTAEIHANVGSGVHASGGATVTLGGESSIHHDTATTRGGGVWLHGSTLIVKDSASIASNTVTNGLGGGIFLDDGAVTLSGEASVTGNDVTGVDGGRGGGIHVATGALTLVDTSVVAGNRSSGDGGGVYLGGGSMTMGPDARIRSNIAGGAGGGLFRDIAVEPVGVECGTNVKDNAPGNCAASAPP